MKSPVLTIVSFLIIFMVVVVSHEFGHYIIARINGIRVNEFTIGFGPALFKKKGRVTEFVIRLFPFGGACIFDGMDGEPTQESDGFNKGFNEAPVWGRISTVLAGPVFNVILAFFLALPLVWVYGADLPNVVVAYEGYPAYEAGIREGDRVIKVDGHRVHLWREVIIRSLMNSGEPMDIVWEHEGQRYSSTITPAWSEEDQRYYIGFSGGTDIISCKNLNLIPYSWYEVRYWLDATIQSLKHMVTGHAKLDDLAGPVGVANVIDETIEDTQQYGGFTVFMNMVNLAVLLSVNLGIMNLLPIPALDGGRLLFLLFEAVSGRRVPPEKEGFVHMIGIILLLVLMVVVMFNDIGRFFR